MLLNKRISIWFFIKKIKHDILTICLYATIVGFLDTYSFMSAISIPLGITSIVGTSVALLLAFRTGQSYERWWEARIIWGSIVNDSRTLIRQVKTFYAGDEKDSFVTDFAYRQIYWCQALANTLRKVPFTGELKRYIEESSITDDNVPNAILSKHADEIKSALKKNMISDFQQTQIDTTLGNLCNSMGRCERIKTTVFPKSYSTLIHFLIYIFMTILPFGLSDEYIAVEIVIGISVPLIFIAIERTSILMQDPFENLPPDIPMTTLSTTIEINIKQMIGDPSIPDKPVERGYYVM